MKILILAFAFLSFAFAQDNYLSNNQASIIAGHIDDMCPDSYCGGDTQFYTNTMSCEADSCTIVFKAIGDSKYHDLRVVGIYNQSIQTKVNSNVFVNYGDYKIGISEEYGDQTIDLDFSCTFKNLKNSRMQYYHNQEMFFAMTIDCITDLEETIYNW